MLIQALLGLRSLILKVIINDNLDQVDLVDFDDYVGYYGLELFVSHVTLQSLRASKVVNDWEDGSHVVLIYPSTERQLVKHLDDQ